MSLPRIRFLILPALLLSGCDFPGRPDPKDKYVYATEVKDFATLYKTNCAGCHGAEGLLGPAPPLADAGFASLYTLAEVEKVLRHGRPGTPMPAFGKEGGGPLTEAQLTILAEGMRTHWPTGKTKPLPKEMIGAPEKGDASRGRVAFARACAGCHGKEGQGGMLNENAIGAINEPAFLALISDQALRRYILTGRPDLGMPGYAEAGEAGGRPADFKPLDAREVADLVALLASWRQPNAREKASR